MQDNTLPAPQPTSSPFERFLERFETILSRAIIPSTPSPSTSSISQPGRDLDADGRNDSGGRIGNKQGYRASPIAGASVSGQPETDVSHSPPRLPIPDTTIPTVRSSSLPDPGQSTALAYNSSPSSTYPQPTSTSLPGRELDADGSGDNGRRSLEFTQGSRAPLGANPEVSHSPTRLSSVPTLSSNAVRSFSNLPPGPSLHPSSSPSPHPPSSPMTSKITFKMNGMDKTKDDFDLLAPGDDPCDNFAPRGGNLSQIFFAIIGNHLLHLLMVEPLLPCLHLIMVACKIFFLPSHRLPLWNEPRRSNSQHIQEDTSTYED